VTLAWLLGFAVVGLASAAAADPGSPIPAPDLTGGAAQTTFEKVPWFGVTALPFQLDPDHSGLSGIQWYALELLNMVILVPTTIVLRGMLIGLQWLLGLSLYRDNATEIDSATRATAGQVFWPLIGCTLAAAGFTLYARAKKESIFGEAVKMVVIATCAVAFVAVPSIFLQPLDQARTAASDAAMLGYSKASQPQGSAAGYPKVDIPRGSANGPVRQLTDSLWNTFAVTPWCYSALGDLDLCRDWGKDILDNTPRWQTVAAQIKVADLANGLSAGSVPDPCPATFGKQCDWVRGQTAGRFGGFLVFLIVTVPFAVLLGALIVYGLMALLSVLFLALLGAPMLVCAAIPGIPRTISAKWAQAMLGSFIQSFIITAITGGVMVMTAILATKIDTYGFFIVGLLNIVMFLVAFRVRGMFENWTGLAHPGSASLGSTYLAIKTLGALGRTAKGITRRATQLTGGAAGMAGRAGLAAASHGAGGFMNAGSRSLPQTTRGDWKPRARLHRFTPGTPMTAADRLDSGAPSMATANGVRTAALPVGSRPTSGPQYHARAGEGGRDRSLPYMPSSTHTAWSPPQYNASAGQGGPDRALTSSHQAPITARPPMRQLTSSAGDPVRRRVVQPSRRDILATRLPREVPLRSNPHAAVARWDPNQTARRPMPVRPADSKYKYAHREKPQTPQRDLLPAGAFPKPAPRRPKESK
jgi:hypothetical protein